MKGKQQLHTANVPTAGDGAIASARIAALFPMPVAAAEMADTTGAPRLSPIEVQQLRDAVPRRRREFAAGRVCARHALAALGATHDSLDRQTDGSPRWPAGFIGSISHTAGLCGAAVSRAGVQLGLGLDMERVAPLEKELLDEICTADERLWLETLSASELEPMAMALFSAKEAFYKCQYPLTGLWLDFRNADLCLLPDGRVELRGVSADMGGLCFAGSYCIEPDHVLTAFWASKR